MTDFEREMPSFRLAETHHGDDLAAIAHRELRDAKRWPELIWINQLTYPYLTDDPNEVTAGVLLRGSLIRIPAPIATPVNEDADERAQVFGRDIALQGKRLSFTEDGDFAVVAGTKNLSQQLKHAIDTPRGQLRRHPEYGCLVWSLKGTVNGPTAEMLGAAHVRATLNADYRVNRVVRSTAAITGDAVIITAVAEAIDGGSVDLFSEVRNA